MSDIAGSVMVCPYSGEGESEPPQLRISGVKVSKRSGGIADKRLGNFKGPDLQEGIVETRGEPEKARPSLHCLLPTAY